ncbi:serine hydrolase [Bradyrhizobium sp. KB893862 SZCCT0404]|nr:serine hydrolase [Bradyrhizobium sp. KB893862 SZCCT0404]
MGRKAMMRAFPAPEESQVTLLNWLTKPANEWAFRNVRQILPTANIRRPPYASPLSRAGRDLEEVRFDGFDGRPTTLLPVIKQLEIDGLLVMHRGTVVWEYYDHGFAPSMQHIVFSVTKSITGVLAGILAEAGKIDPDDAILKYLPEAKGTAYEAARIRHLLDMAVGLHWEEDYVDPDGDVARYRRACGWKVNPEGGLPSPHLREFLLSMRPNGGAHGDKFHYASPNTDLLGWILERACGAAFAELVGQYIWAPLGAEDDAYVTLDAYGAARAAAGFCATLRDLGRFGEMMRNNGVSAGRQVVPRWWIDDIQNGGDAAAWAKGEFTKLFPEGNYRNKWYTPQRGRRAFCAIGVHGQYVYVDPEDETVIVRVSSQPVAFEVVNDRVWIRACRAIGERLRF